MASAVLPHIEAPAETGIPVRPLVPITVAAVSFRLCGSRCDITITPGVLNSKPWIKGTPRTVSDVLEYLAGGMTEAQIMADFPTLKPEHLRATLVFAATREQCLATQKVRSWLKKGA